MIGSIYARCASLFTETMQAVIKEECLGAAAEHCRIEKAKLGEQIGDYAALSVAMESSLGNP